MTRGAECVSCVTGPICSPGEEAGSVTRLDYGTPGIIPVVTEVMNEEPKIAKAAMTAALLAHFRSATDE